MLRLENVNTYYGYSHILQAYLMEKGQIRMCGNLEELNCRVDEVVRCLGVKI